MGVNEDANRLPRCQIHKVQTECELDADADRNVLFCKG